MNINKKPIVGVYGVVSVGKSTFLNALLRTNEFETGIGETTKNIYILQHDTEIKKLNFDDVSFTKNYILKDLDILNSFSIVDLPGANKSFSDAEITKVIEKLDVIVWILDIQGDISSRDVDFIQNVLLKNMIKTVVILNKIDSGVEDVDFENAQESQEFIDDITSRKNKILKFFQDEKAEELLVAVFPMSAKKLFSSILKNDNLMYKEQHEKIEEMLISISKSAMHQKRVFQNLYNGLKSNVEKMLNENSKIVLNNYRDSLENELFNIDDTLIMSEEIKEHIDTTKIIDENLNIFVINEEYKEILSEIEIQLEKELS